MPQTAAYSPRATGHRNRASDLAVPEEQVVGASTSRSTAKSHQR